MVASRVEASGSGAAKCQRRVQWPLSRSNAAGQLSHRCFQWRHSLSQRSVRTSCARCATGRPCPKVMESYQTWFAEGPELSVLRMLGLFDRPVDEKVLGILLIPPAIRGLTESLTDLSPTEWRTILARLRRARLLAGEDPQNRGHLDTHPLVREYYGEQLRSQRTDAWKECNRRLFYYYRTLWAIH